MFAVSMWACTYVMVNVYTQQVANYSHHMCTDQSVSLYVLHCSQALQHNYKMNCAIFHNFLLKKFWKENNIYFMHNILHSSVQYSTSVFSRAEGQHHAWNDHVSRDLEWHSPREEHLLSRLWVEGRVIQSLCPPETFFCCSWWTLTTSKISWGKWCAYVKDRKCEHWSILWIDDAKVISYAQWHKWHE